VYATRRAVELWTAAVIAAAGAVVVGESVTHDIAWNEAGPGSGYFPFRVGLLLIAVALVQMIRSLPADGSRKASTGGTGSTRIEGRAVGPVIFVTRDELRRSLSVFWPTAALVAAMFLLGTYLPCGVYLAWMMKRHGGRRWITSAVYGAAVMVVFFLIFDVWFGVPLAPGPLA
jgi:hypothetical protein